jgi:hypothetical protein
MIDINSVGRIYYKDTSPTLPDGNNVVALVVNGKPVDFTDAAKYYNVSTVNYLAAGSCNFNDGGVSLWPLNQIAHDTQYYVRDAVIDYIKAMGTVSPKVEGRLLFGDKDAPTFTINVPKEQSYLHSEFPVVDISAADATSGTTPSFAPPSGVKIIEAWVDGVSVLNGQKIDLHVMTLGQHQFTATVKDYYGNTATPQTVNFTITATVQSMKESVNLFYADGSIKSASVRDGLLSKLNTAQMYLNSGNKKAAINALNALISQVKAQSGKQITKATADLLIADANYVIANPKY